MSAWTLLLRLEGPMQSWGVNSRFDDRETGLEPSKSGVVGLLCAAMGISRYADDAVAELASHEMAVRVDRQGSLRHDFVTIGAGRWPGRRYGAAKANGHPPDAVVSRRSYLADASFLVALGGSDLSRLEEIDVALDSPVWPLCLGRKSYVPSVPVRHGTGPVPSRPIDALMRARWGDGDPRRRLVVEVSPMGGGRPRDDVPQSFRRDGRLYSRRYVRDIAISSLPGDGEVLIPRSLSH